MRLLLAFFLLLPPFCAYSQLIESFDGPEITSTYPWEGTLDKFVINKQGELQLYGFRARDYALLFQATSFLHNNEWRCTVRSEAACSSSNYMKIYLWSRYPDMEEPGEAIFIRLGYTNKNIAFCYQLGNRKPVVLLEGRALFGTPGQVEIKAETDDEGYCRIYSRTSSEESFYEEGVAELPYTEASGYFMLGVHHTNAHNQNKFFDDIYIRKFRVKGDPSEEEDPRLLRLEQESDFSLLAHFNKPVTAGYASFNLSGIGEVLEIEQSDDDLILRLVWEEPMRKGERYTLTYHAIYDYAGNEIQGSISFVATNGTTAPQPEPGETTPVRPLDIIFNELLPNPFPGGEEYIELYNRTGEEVSLFGLSIATRKSDGTLSTPYPLATPGAKIQPGGFVLLTRNREGVLPYYTASSPENIHDVKIPVLANTTSCLVLFRSGDKQIIDEVKYHSNWHAPSIREQKGVALERINPDAETQDGNNWISATSAAGYGTPGYRNSQFGSASTGEKNGVGSPRYSKDTGEYTISYSLELPGYNCRIRIYNLSGIQVAEIANHELLGSNGELTWNGKASNGNRLRPGPYVLYVELYHVSGQRKRDKKVFLVH